MKHRRPENGMENNQSNVAIRESKSGENGVGESAYLGISHGVSASENPALRKKLMCRR
jgi:hypothetical protein